MVCLGDLRSLDASLSASRRVLTPVSLAGYSLAHELDVRSDVRLSRARHAVNGTRCTNLGRRDARPLDAEAGARMGVSYQAVHAAAKVIEKVVPKIIEKCKSGEMALNQASRH